MLHVIACELYDWSNEIYELHKDAQDFALRFDRGDEVSRGCGDNGMRLRDGWR